MTYYKVVMKMDSKYYSAIADRHSVRVEYKINKFVFPQIPNSKLFVFNNLEAASTFLGRERHFDIFSFHIFKCEVKNPIEAKEIGGFLLPEQIEEFWKNQNSQHSVPAIPHTYICDAVKLVEEMVKVIK